MTEEENKKYIKENGAILIISSDDRLEDQARSFGFRNIDRFVSEGEANLFLEKHPEILNQYAMIFLAKPYPEDKCNIKYSFLNNIDLDKTYFFRINYEEDYFEIINCNETGIFRDGRIEWYGKNDFESILSEDYVISISDNLKKDLYSPYKAINEYKTKTLLLPNNIRDIKVLYIKSYYCDEENLKREEKGLSENLGVNVTLRDRISWTIQDVYDSDIIIGDVINSFINSDKRLSIFAKYISNITDKKFVLYAPSSNVSIYQHSLVPGVVLEEDYYYPNKLLKTTYYSFSIMDNVVQKKDEKEIILYPKFDAECLYEFISMYVFEYIHQANILCPGTFNENKFMSKDELQQLAQRKEQENNEYKEKIQKEAEEAEKIRLEKVEIQRKEDEKISISRIKIEEAYSTAKKYIENRNYIDINLENFEVIKDGKNIIVTRYFNGRPILKVTFDKENEGDYMYTFIVEKSNKKGRLDKPITVDYNANYNGSSYDMYKNSNADEKITKLIKGIISTIEKEIKPAVSDFETSSKNIRGYKDSNGSKRRNKAHYSYIKTRNNKNTDKK